MRRTFLSLAMAPFIALSVFVTPVSAGDQANKQVGSAETEIVTLTCPSSPNCVSSFSHGEHRVNPLSYPGKDTATIRKILLAWIKQDPRAHVTYSGPDIIKAKFKSRFFGFVDDLTLLIQSDGLVDVRSASRTGYYDFGVNRERIETLRSKTQNK
ncbi:DUF1499 domain-containing protein [Sansalvadorimonas sp. 2012CJ34-2]|uniref:DUF1499 domain-containing protein n=1 Tax=Parendozoicomonas callyspongiae TaxID=2942213 RepID=A0ABT0PGG7_9GAMM|nr:DUF1499 domain-containing protein [Sansalvadorimonas sp. 2012CJ34-2]MCL6269857.1 DUF1499 domain-containing protein [Sansalvadorimonas sp. 2012CJ34-2]